MYTLRKFRVALSLLGARDANQRLNAEVIGTVKAFGKRLMTTLSLPLIDKLTDHCFEVFHY